MERSGTPIDSPDLLSGPCWLITVGSDHVAENDRVPQCVVQRLVRVGKVRVNPLAGHIALMGLREWRSHQRHGIARNVEGRWKEWTSPCKLM